jgi:hypothetical protein
MPEPTQFRVVVSQNTHSQLRRVEMPSCTDARACVCAV